MQAMRCPEQTHQPLVDRDDWHRVQTTLNREPRAPRRHDTRYLLRGRVHCAVCGRRMTGTNQGNDRRYYRCELRRSRPGARIDHPVDVYVREQPLVEALDEWLNELFAADRAAETAQTVVEAAAHDPAHQSRVEEGQHSLADARRKLAQYRAALDGGADPATVTTWITDAAAQERAALVELEHLVAQARDCQELCVSGVI